VSKQTYDPAIRNTDCGKKLYNAWLRMRRYPHSKEWDHFPTFYEWSMQNGYEEGAWLKRDDKNVQFDDQNCFWYVQITQECLDGWNKAVNRIRKHYGMSPLEGTDYGDL
jgi:hypothetical protein